jgi:hypothetical protein
MLSQECVAQLLPPSQREGAAGMPHYASAVKLTKYTVPNGCIVYQPRAIGAAPACGRSAHPLSRAHSLSPLQLTILVIAFLIVAVCVIAIVCTYSML